ncbi:TOMM precursor leader peptide-binding protein [Sporocytophaga myxococcoides]|uniref:TOMM precursor leader peptide-binding protein n=1 Tax=Sporocytophaga myxococcoides TaxID=153721 RepID=UPI00040F4FE3|nr:TOMM precursor leader peptide-binding protein [Sporocytophaga myxococcoides]
MKTFEGINASILKELSWRPFSTLELIEKYIQRFPSPYIVYALKTLENNKLIVTEDKFKTLKYTERSLLSEALQWPRQYRVQQLPQLFFAGTWEQVKSKLDSGLSEPILPIVTHINGALIGPVLKDQNAVCVECLLFKINQNNSFQIWLKRHSVDPLISFYVSDSLIEGIQNVLGEIAKDPLQLAQQMVFVDENGKRSLHQITRRPNCHHCGDPLLMTKLMESPIQLKNDSSVFNYAYGYRTTKPEVTWDRFKHLIDPVLGTIHQMDTVCKLDNEGIFVYSARYPVVPMKERPHSSEFQTEAYGKGITPIASQVSALCEAIERASLRYYGDEPVIYGTAHEMGKTALLPQSFQYFHPHQSEYPNATHALGPVPKEISDQEAIAWLPAWSLRDQERRFLPMDAVLYGHDKLEQERVAVFESNGLSAGNNMEEAILQGLLELIERDAVSIWWFNKLSRPSADVSIMTLDVWFTKALKALQDQGWKITFLDLTIDTGVLVIAAVGEMKGSYLTGYGCHTDPCLAFNRALTELIQVKELMQPVKPPKGYEDTDYLCPSQYGKRFPILSDVNASRGLGNLIQNIVDHLALLDIDTIVLNSTRPDIGLPVVKVVCPGLRAFRPRFAAGRLYEVPVKLGLRNQCTAYEQLNPMWLTIQSFKQEVTIENHIEK